MQIEDPLDDVLWIPRASSRVKEHFYSRQLHFKVLRPLQDFMTFCQCSTDGYCSLRQLTSPWVWMRDLRASEHAVSLCCRHQAFAYKSQSSGSVNKPTEETFYLMTFIVLRLDLGKLLFHIAIKRRKTNHDKRREKSQKSINSAFPPKLLD